jgi:bis(5'-nucleosyl)-tetraphosphatase (symmetrical)
MDKKYNYIIGDIHGCFEELLELEAKIKVHSAKENVLPFIISCGDLIDRGAFSKQVIEHFIKGKKNKSHTAVIGNHEVMMLQVFEHFSPEKLTVEFPQFLETFADIYALTKIYFPETSFEVFIQKMKNIWLDEGGTETLESFTINEPDLSKINISKKIMDYLIKLPVFYEGETFIVTHGLAQKSDLEKIKTKYRKKFPDEIFDIKRAVNSVIWNRTTPSGKINKKLHISGHTPYKEVRELKEVNALQIDTACVYGNKLTAYCVETQTFLSVKAKKAYRSILLKD